jgi:cysteinyl-tRNA synthetase
LRELGAIFGLFRSRPSGPVSEVSIEPKLLGLVLELREEARRRKDFDQADRIRAELARLDFLIEDRPEGPTWRRKS